MILNESTNGRVSLAGIVGACLLAVVALPGWSRNGSAAAATAPERSPARNESGRSQTEQARTSIGAQAQKEVDRNDAEQTNPVLDNDVEVVAPLRPLDDLLRKQWAVCLERRNAVFSAEGKQTPEWWRVTKETSPLTVHGPKLLKYAQDHPGTPESFICLAYLVEGAGGDLFLAACDELIAHHRDNPALSWLCSTRTDALRYSQNCSFLSRLRTESMNPDVRAAATFQMARLLDGCIEVHSRIASFRDLYATAGALEVRPDIRHGLETLAKLNPEELAVERDKLLRQVTDEFGAARPWTATRTFPRLNYVFRENPGAETFQKLAEGLSYEIENLQQGCIAPDFDGTLSDGQPFRLRERRGRPTLLMFSFKGCGPCEAMYPAMRAFQERFSNAGFSVIGIMADQERDTVIATQKSGDISWPCVWDGPSGPIAEAYRIRGFPTFILLDGDGRIAAPRGLRLKRHLVKYIEDLLRQK